MKHLKDNQLTFGDLMEYVFDPLMGQGSVCWHQFFIKDGRALQILDWWTSSKNSRSARTEVAAWAFDYTTKAVSREAREVTRSKRLQTAGKVFDESFVMSFSYNRCREWLENSLAPVAMKIFRAFSVPKRERTPTRSQKSNMVCFGIYLLRGYILISTGC